MGNLPIGGSLQKTKHKVQRALLLHGQAQVSLVGPGRRALQACCAGRTGLLCLEHHTDQQPCLPPPMPTALPEQGSRHPVSSGCCEVA